MNFIHYKDQLSVDLDKVTSLYKDYWVLGDKELIVFKFNVSGKEFSDRDSWRFEKENERDAVYEAVMKKYSQDMEDVIDHYEYVNRGAPRL